jgi:hypothetical protein
VRKSGVSYPRSLFRVDEVRRRKAVSRIDGRRGTVRLEGSEEEEGEEGQVADLCKERMGGSPSLRRYFLSLFWKRFRCSFSLEVLRQALNKMGILFRSKRALAKLDFQEGRRSRGEDCDPPSSGHSSRLCCSGLNGWYRVTDTEDGALRGCAYWQGQGLPGSGVNPALSQCNLRAAAERPGRDGRSNRISAP